MVKHVYICDRCGKEMTEDEVVTINQHGMFDLWVLKQNEICKGCYRGLRQYLGDSKYEESLEVFCDGQKVNRIEVNSRR